MELLENGEFKIGDRGDGADKVRNVDWTAARERDMTAAAAVTAAAADNDLIIVLHLSNIIFSFSSAGF